ncbi:MAG: MBL fold metallo-hydrolase [Desulfobacterales bacterium]|nr:MBL fold metallo-hydrolase [Desulfobacterales bacterium]
MIVNQPGRITDGLHMLGSAVMPMYLIEADMPAIIDAGFSFLAQGYADALRQILGHKGPALCLLTHSHYDHVGAVGGLKQRFARLSVAASAGAARVLQKPKAVELIRTLNLVAREMAEALAVPIVDEDFQPFCVDRICADGEVIELGAGSHLRVLETPGHTRDCLSYYLVEKKALFVSEAAGIPDQTGDIICDCLVDYDMYMASMEKIRALEIDYLCLGHRGVYTGKDAAAHLTAAAVRCEAFFNTTAAMLHETRGDLKAVIRRIRETEYDVKPSPKQPEPAYLLNLEARVAAVQRSVARRQETGGEFILT